MKIRLILAESPSEKVWKGLVSIGKRTFKITIWIGTTTTPCSALLQCADWTEIEEGGTLYPAIVKALEEWDAPRVESDTSQIMTRRAESRFKGIPQEALEEIMKVLKGGGEMHEQEEAKRTDSD